MATSAIREAPNCDDLLGTIEKDTGLSVRVISGEDEARYGWLAMVNSTTVEDGYGIEIGGGSVQLMRMQDRRLKDVLCVRWRLRRRRTINLGLTDSYLTRWLT